MRELGWRTQEISEATGPVRDVDIIARVVNFQRIEKPPHMAIDQKIDTSEYYAIVVVDSNKAYYTLDFRSFHVKFFSVGEVVKIRSVTMYILF